MKRSLLKYFLVVLGVFFLCCNKSYALVVDSNEVTLTKGGEESVNLYVDTKEEITSVTFSLTFTTYDMPAIFYATDGLTDNNPYAIKHTLEFSESKTGKILLGSVKINIKSNAEVNLGEVNINNATATTVDGNTINLDSQDIEIRIGTPKKETNLLKEIKSSIVKITLKDDVYEYDTVVNNDVEELDLEAVAKEDSYKTTISSQKLDDNGGVITISVTGGNNTEEYKINVSKVKKVEDITIDDSSSFKEDNSYKTKWIIVIIISIIGIVVGGVLFRKSK